MRYVGIVFMPISTLTLAVAPVAVAVAYGRGAFTPEALAETAHVVAAFAPLIVTLMLSQTSWSPRARRAAVLLMAGTLSMILNWH
jgi:peptidoglycan biosynthesis protein MviN/MurJ (putative lipid II flippase)